MFSFGTKVHSDSEEQTPILTYEISHYVAAVN